MWQRVNTHHIPCLDLELIYGGIWSSEYRQQPLLQQQGGFVGGEGGGREVAMLAQG
jgi:hypothetical protein